MPLTNHNDVNFDIDLDFGKVKEQEVVDYFESDGRIEVKTERYRVTSVKSNKEWKETGNIAIEYKYKGKPSGISTTNAKTWIHLLSDEDEVVGGFIIKTKILKIRLKEMLKNGTARTIKGGDNNNSEMILVPIKEIYNYGGF